MFKKEVKRAFITLVCLIAVVLGISLICQAVTTISTDITTGGNVGIGTTTPNWGLQAAGNVAYLALTDTSAGTDDKHWIFQSNRGNLFIGTSTDDLSATSTHLVINNNGNVGIGMAPTEAELQIASSTNSDYTRLLFHTGNG